MAQYGSAAKSEIVVWRSVVEEEDMRDL